MFLRIFTVFKLFREKNMIDRIIIPLWHFFIFTLLWIPYFQQLNAYGESVKSPYL